MELSKTKNRNIHRPLHIYSGHCYFLTARCYKGFKYFRGERKKILKAKMAELSEEMDIGILSWVVLDNHYHLLFLLKHPEGTTSASSSDGKLAFAIPYDKRREKLTCFVRRLHSITSKEINRLDRTPGRKIWYQYWDYCIRDKRDFWTHFNYILKNPIKHGLVSSLIESFRYEYSSNSVWLDRFGLDGLYEGFIKFPVRQVIFL